MCTSRARLLGWAGLLGKMAGSYQVAFIAFPRRVTQPLILFIIIFLLLRQNISLEFLDSIQLESIRLRSI
jgi:hypothetical protein